MFATMPRHLDLDPLIVRAEYEAGATIQEIAEHHGVSISPVRYRLKLTETAIRPRAGSGILPTRQDPSYMQKWRQAHLSVPNNRIRALVELARQRAHDNDRVFDEAVFALANDPPTHCLCCTIELDYSTLQRSRYNRSPSLDRVDNTLGYTVQNTRIICLRCNYLKNNASLDDLRKLLVYAASRLEI